jgi:hypothetical protein
MAVGLVAHDCAESLAGVLACQLAFPIEIREIAQPLPTRAGLLLLLPRYGAGQGEHCCRCLIERGVQLTGRCLRIVGG